MKTVFLLILVIVIVLIGALVYVKQSNQQGVSTQYSSLPVSTPNLNPKNKESKMEILSPAFQHNQPIPDKYSTDGENVNPRLQFINVPAGAKSLVLIVDDPDAPSGTWTHWTVWNIPTTTSEVAENSVPAGATQGITSSGTSGYSGPRPPSGTHRYFFKLYALDTILNLDPKSNVDAIVHEMDGHVVAEAELIGLYSKK